MKGSRRLLLTSLGLCALLMFIGGATSAFAQDTGMRLKGKMVAEGGVELLSQIGDESNGAGWQITAISGESGNASLETVAKVAPGKMAISQSFYVASDMAPMEAVQTTYSCMDPIEPIEDGNTTLTEQVSAVGITSTIPDGATMDTHCEAVGIDDGGGKIQTYKEGHELLNLGGTTMRHLDMSGDVANALVRVDMEIEGKCQRDESFSIQNTLPENVPRWYDVCPGE